MGNPQGIKMEFDEIKVKDAWLKAQLGKYCDQCIELAEAVPQSMLDDCAWGGEMVKTKFFMKCMMTWKLKENFGQVDNLVEETKIPENQLYEIVKMMLKGPEKMMMEMSLTTKTTKITS